LTLRWLVSPLAGLGPGGAFMFPILTAPLIP